MNNRGGQLDVSRVSRIRQPPIAQVVARDAIDRLFRADLTPTDRTVFLALLRLICLYDRIEDYVSNRQIADTTGIDVRHVKRSLNNLHDSGVITRLSGIGKMTSLIKLSTEGARDAPSEGAKSATTEGASFDNQRGRNPPPHTSSSFLMYPDRARGRDGAREREATTDPILRKDDKGYVYVVNEDDTREA